MDNLSTSTEKQMNHSTKYTKLNYIKYHTNFNVDDEFG